MENKVKKVKVDYAAIIREFEMYGRGRSLRQFCDESNYTYANVRKHSIASEAFCMNQVTFALQNIKIRLWYFAYVFSRLIEGEKDYEKLLPSAVAR